MGKKYKVIGLMSGTSLDGLDIAYCTFRHNTGKWSYTLRNTQTLPYNKTWREKLISAVSLGGYELTVLDKEYGRYTGKAVNAFIEKNGIRPQFIASHGHTVFHQPEQKLTLQIGDGASIAAETGLPTISDFRSLDIALGGQGAPLVPLGDKLLFGEWTACLNLGGFANISYDHLPPGSKRPVRLAFDICPVNIVLNKLAQKRGKPYDKNGAIAKRGKLNLFLLEKLNALPYYRIKSPKSLGREWVEKEFMPLLSSSRIPVEDQLRTVTEHIAIQLGKAIDRITGKQFGTIFLSGGGTHNHFLRDRIPHKPGVILVIPEDKEIAFKEALVFAFLGVLRWRGEVNTLSTVTGAERDSCGGVIYTAGY